MKKLDISGEKGNAYFILGLAQKYAGQLDIDAEAIIKELTVGNYNDLLRGFNDRFGSFVQLVSPHEISSIESGLYSIESNDYI